MEVRVVFRFNKLTGEIERFEVEQSSALPLAEHEREHDRLAAEIGSLLERLPRLDEISPGALPFTSASRPETIAEAANDEEPMRQESTPLEEK
jgi:hypothetical protein